MRSGCPEPTRIRVALARKCHIEFIRWSLPIAMASTAYETHRSVMEGREFPLAYLDRDALDGNIRTTRQRTGNLPVRVASKSVRCRDVLRYILDHEGFRGVMCYTGHEAAHLAAHGFADLLVAYPIWHHTELEAVCNVIEAGTRVTLVVDDGAHVERIGKTAVENGVEVPVCIDIDMSTDHFGIYFGVRRSGIRTPDG